MMLQCASCGRRYEYGQEELCPKCGAYNNPSDSQRKDLEAQVLRERVAANRGDCNPDCMPEGYGGHSHLSTQQRMDYRHAEPRSSYQTKAPEKKKTPLFLIVILIIIFIQVLPMLVSFLGYLFYSYI